MSGKSDLTTPNESLTYYFEDTLEIDPENNNSQAPHSLPSYNSMASLHHSKQFVDSKFEKSKTRLID